MGVVSPVIAGHGGFSHFNCHCERSQPRHAPRRRGIQYAAASCSITNVSGILDHPHARAMTTENVAGSCSAKHTFAFSRREAPEVYKNLSLQEGAGDAGCALHPRSRVQNCAIVAHTSIQVQRKHSGIPHAMVLRLMPCSPRRRIRLATVAAGLMVIPIRSDRNRHRQLGTSNGCRVHTVLPYASAPFILRAVNRSRETRPAITLRADAAASTASHPNVRDDGQRPSRQG
jgi:hypothetical protein